MNREIKFRAWDKKESRWIKLQGFKVQSEELLPWEYRQEDGKTVEWYYMPEDCEVMRYTGFNKNDIEIYENDLISLNGKYLIEVRFEEGKFVCHHVNNDYGRWGDLHRLFDLDYRRVDFFVIGNTHEHANLLATGKG